MEKSIKEEDFSKNHKSEYLSHGSGLITKVLVLLESLFSQDGQIWNRKSLVEPSLRKVQDFQKVNIGTE